MLKEITEEELFLVKRMIDGDIESFKYFFDKYYNDLCNFIHVYLHNKALSEEIAQDLFVYFWENKSYIKIDRSVKSFLFSASRYKCLNLIRDTKNHQRLIGRISKEEPMFIPEQESSCLDTDEFKKILAAAVDQLAPKCQEIFLLSKIEELSNKEIAARLGISVKTVENQMTIALKKLREYLLPFRGKIFLFFLFSIFSA